MTPAGSNPHPVVRKDPLSEMSYRHPGARCRSVEAEVFTMKLEDVLLLVRDARAAIESGRVEDAAWLLEAIEEDLADVEDAVVYY